MRSAVVLMLASGSLEFDLTGLGRNQPNRRWT
jgi:hypothetical protein